MHPDDQVVQTESRLQNPSVVLRQVIKEKITEALGDEEAPGTVTLHATVKVEGATTTGVVKAAEFSLADLYKYSQSDAIAFATEASRIAKYIEEVLSIKDDEFEFDLKAGSVWARLRSLKSYVSTSEQHGELIASLLQIAAIEAGNAPSIAKLTSLKTALATLAGKVRLSNKTLDDLFDALEAGGFDLGPAF